MSAVIHAARGALRKLLVVGILAAFIGAPSLAQAGTISEPTAPAQETPGARPGVSVPTALSADEAPGYAKREAASPGLGNFAGGDGGIYIGGGVVTVLLIVLLIVLIV